MGGQQFPRELTLNQEAVPHVSHAHHQTPNPAALTHHRRAAEPDASRTLLGSGQLGQKCAGHKDLSQPRDDQLQHERRNGQRTLFGDVPEAVADGGLGLQREQVGAGQRVHVQHARRVIRRRVGVEVAVPQADEVEDDSKHEPRGDEGGGEQRDLVAPLHVHHCGPDVVQEELDHPFYIINLHVTAAVFGHHTPHVIRHAAGEMQKSAFTIYLSTTTKVYAGLIMS